MDIEADKIQVYGERTFGDMLRDLEERNDNRKKSIEELVDKLTDMVDNPDNAIVLVPLIKEYLEIDVNNDKHKVDMMKILQKLYKTKINADDISGGGDLSEEVKNMVKEAADGPEVDEDPFDGEDPADAVQDEDQQVFEDDPELKDLEDRTADALDEIDDR